MANFALSASPNNPRVRGALNYRAGNHEAAIADLNQSALVVPSRAWDLLFLAMAHSQLGHGDRPKRSFHRAPDWIELAYRKPQVESNSSWIGRWESLEVDHLGNEAGHLIHGTP
jgi:hypothetical protein